MKTFFHRPQSVFLRRVLFQVHLWCGIAAGLYIVVVCVTGASLVFRINMQRAAFPHLFTPSAPTMVSPAMVLERLRAAYPNDRVSGIDTPSTERPTYLAYVSSGDDFLTVLVDPATGGVLGLLPDRSIIRTLQELHFDLLGGRTGRIVNGVGAGVLLVMCLTGVVIWWPGVANWRRALVVDRRRSWKRITFDLHSAIGIWTVAVIVLWAVTGLYFVFPSSFRAIVNRVSPITSVRAPTSTRPADDAAPRPWSELIDAAQEPMRGRFVARVVLPFNERAAFHVLFSDRQPTPAGSALTSVYVDQYSGRLLAQPPNGASSAGDVVMSWVAPLHVGGFGGRGIKVLWLILGLSPPALFVTGAMMWWTRRRAYAGPAPARVGRAAAASDV